MTSRDGFVVYHAPGRHARIMLWRDFDALRTAVTAARANVGSNRVISDNGVGGLISQSRGFQFQHAGLTPLGLREREPGS